MRKGLVPAAEARKILLRDAAPQGEEYISLQEAAGRVLSRDLAARRTQPPFRASAMDGYAVLHQDVEVVPKTLRITGSSAAGRPFTGRVESGEAVRIFTGAPVPEGADTIVIQENATQRGSDVEILAAAERGRYIRPAGLDFRQGDVLLKAGNMLDPQRLSLAASMNHPRLPVWRTPVVALLATGDELVAPGDEPGDSQIIASNTYGLAAMVAESGGAVLDLGIAGDGATELASVFEHAIETGADLILTTGGASVGDHDLVMPVLEGMGARFDFSRIAMRPGKPMLAGRLDRKGRTVRLVGLAGNPVSSIVAGYMFVRPLVSRLAGRPFVHSAPVPAILARDLDANPATRGVRPAQTDWSRGAR